MKSRTILLAMAILFLLAACGRGEDLDAPPEIIYGQDVCDECSMIINEPRFAASYVTTDGEVRRFDDIGGMVAYTHKHVEQVHRFWLHDYNTEEWIQAQDAVIVQSQGLVTPMAWGLAAFASLQEAEQFVAENGGTITDWRTLQDAVGAGELDPESLSEHLHEH